MRWKNIKLWLDERFPVANFISGAFLYLLARAVVELAWPQAGRSWGYWDFFGMLIPAMHLFLLRVFDEHKDFETDKIHYPQRVVQRGLVSLEEIRKLGYVAGVIQIVSFILMSPTQVSVILYLGLWVWTTLMTKEFFVGERLKGSLFLYGLLHLLITPILLSLLLSLVSEAAFSGSAWVYTLVLAFLTGWLYELARKTKGKEEETGDLSYSKIWGPSKSMMILMISNIVTLSFTALFFRSLGLQQWYFDMILLGLAILSCLSSIQYTKSTVAKSRKNNEKIVALISAYIFVTPVVVTFL